MSQEMQSNATQDFWSFVAVLRNKTQVSILGEINRNVGNILAIGFYYKGQYRGEVNLADSSLRHILVRRVRTTFTEDLKQKKQSVTYLLGWQTTANGKNVKAILELDEDGTLFMKNDDKGVRL